MQRRETKREIYCGRTCGQRESGGGRIVNQGRAHGAPKKLHWRYDGGRTYAAHKDPAGHELDIRMGRTA